MARRNQPVRLYLLFNLDCEDSLNKELAFRGLVASLIVTALVGPIVLRLLPGWSGLVSEVGVGGAWTLSVVSHLIYALVIGVDTFLFFNLLGKFKQEGSVFGAGLSAAVTVTVVNIASLSKSIELSFLVFVLFTAWLSWLINFAVFIAIKLIRKTRPPV